MLLLGLTAAADFEYFSFQLVSFNEKGSPEGTPKGVEAGPQLFNRHEAKAGQKAGFDKLKDPESPYDLFRERVGLR
jgi:hypothetical protein